MTNPTTDQTPLRDRIAEALTAAAYECDGKCGLSEQECYDAHPIVFSARCNGTTHVDAPVTAIADVVLAVLPAPADRAAVLRDAYEIAHAEGLRLNALEAEIGVGPYRGALAVAHLLRKAISDAQPRPMAAEHQPRRGDQFEAWLKTQRDEYRDSDRGQWSVLDDLLDRYRLHADTGTPLPCGECDHPKSAHNEGDDPVTPGQCADCPEDDDRHDYQPAGARP